jgi:hypothetical protein
VRAEDAQGIHEGGRLGEDDVAGIDENAGDEIDALLGAVGDENVGGIDRRAPGRHALGDEIA